MLAPIAAMPFVARMLRAALAAAWLLAFAAPSAAHGDHQTQIAEMDRLVAAQPRNAALILRRAELHRIHREFPAADADYAHVIELEPGHPEVHWMRARGRLESGDAASALTALDRFLAQSPDHASARLTRARALSAVARYADAVADYVVAIDRMPQPEPDRYLELVAAQRAAATPWGVQLATIDRGIARLGNVPSLEDAALDIEIGAERWDDALRRLDRLAASAARKEQLWYRRGLVLLQAGRKSDAVAAFRASRQAIDKLPAALRSPRAVTQLTEQVEHELQLLAGQTSNATAPIKVE